MTAKTRVLFVDDEPFVLQALQRLLRNMRAEWEMVFAESGPKGLEALALAPFDVVVADMQMPGMNGAEFLNRVMELYPGTVRLVLSGHADQDLILKVEGAAHQFLSKPCDPELLRSVIVDACDISGRMRSEEIRNVLGRIAHLPVIPAIYQEIMALLVLESTSVEELGNVVRRDPGMTANVLKLVNSAYFGLRHRVSDPGEAVSYLGVDTLKSLALLHGIFAQVQTFPRCFNAGRLWGHSLELAATCREIARVEGLDKGTQSECFTGGLIHDVGLLILASGFPAEYGQIARILVEEPMDLLSAEMRVLGVHHGEVGGHLLGLWGLPSSVVEAVTHHHSQPARPGVSPALVVYAAEALSTSQGDFGVFGVHRVCDLQYLSAALGQEMDTWKQILDGIQEESTGR